jgi:hypothetical protein
VQGRLLSLTALFLVHIFEVGPQEVEVRSPVNMLGGNTQLKEESAILSLGKLREEKKPG